MKILFFIDNIIEQKINKHLILGNEYQIAGSLNDSQQREIEIPEFINFNVEASDNIYDDPQKSWGEFAFCPTCFGQFFLKPKALCKYKVKFSYHGLEAELYGEDVPDEKITGNFV